MKMGSIRINIELSKSEYRMLEKGAKLLTDLDEKQRIYDAESFLNYAIWSGIEDLQKQCTFNEN